MNPFGLDGKRILVTGASSGIGKATAQACAQMGAMVVATGRDIERLRANVAEFGAGHTYIQADVTSQADIERLASTVDKLDGVVCCAGTLQTVPTRYIEHQHLQMQFETNMYSVALLMSALIQAKKLNKGGSIVFIGSAAADIAPERGNAIYGATKAALQSYARVLALELVGRKIRVNCIAPGVVKTPFLNNFDITEEELAQNEKKYPLGFGEPMDVAYAVCYLLSNAARWVTGTVLHLDGGLSLG